MTEGKKWPENWSAKETVDLGTQHLPEDVVKQEVILGIWITTDEDNPRRGVASVGLRIGERNNPKLTPDEVDYLKHILTYGVRHIEKKGE